MDKKPNFSALLTFYNATKTGKYAPYATELRIEIEFPFQKKRIYANVIFYNVELIFPGDIITSDLLLFTEEEIILKIYIGLDFNFYINNKMIGTGVVSKLYEQKDLW